MSVVEKKFDFQHLLRTLIALPEDLDLILRIHMVGD